LNREPQKEIERVATEFLCVTPLPASGPTHQLRNHAVPQFYPAITSIWISFLCLSEKDSHIQFSGIIVDCLGLL